MVLRVKHNKLFRILLVTFILCTQSQYSQAGLSRSTEHNQLHFLHDSAPLYTLLLTRFVDYQGCKARGEYKLQGTTNKMIAI